MVYCVLHQPADYIRHPGCVPTFQHTYHIRPHFVGLWSDLTSHVSLYHHQSITYLNNLSVFLSDSVRRTFLSTLPACGLCSDSLALVFLSTLPACGLCSDSLAFMSLSDLRIVNNLVLSSRSGVGLPESNWSSPASTSYIKKSIVK